MDLLLSNIRKLPDEIILHEIIPYTYEKQSPKLLGDIRSFYITRDHLVAFYAEKYQNMPEEDSIAWLDNDISRFMNNNIPTMYGISDGNIDKMKRIYFFRDKSNEFIIQFLSFEMHLKLTSSTSINMCIGCLLPHERERLIAFAHSLY